MQLALDKLAAREWWFDEVINYETGEQNEHLIKTKPFPPDAFIIDFRIFRGIL